MAWGMVIGGAISLVGAYASSQSASDSAQATAQDRALAARQQLELKRQYQLQDRQYNQNAIGAWGKYLDPNNAPVAGPASAPQGPAAAGTTAPPAAGTGNSDGIITNPNDPMFAANPTAPASDALPMRYPAAFAGLQPVNGSMPTSMWKQWTPPPVIKHG